MVEQKSSKEKPEEMKDSKSLLQKAYQNRIDEIRSAWKHQNYFTTLPLWAQMEDRTRPHRQVIEETKIALHDIDEATKDIIIREILLTLRCNSCERGRTKQCNFSVCIRGLLSGKDIGGL
ncbi:MAG: hypothetical protein JSV49_10085 [Thermoplasmata archaeon]|nr:MAG: hypothetical protein JSV49_10085 [Thermoplasmata archaeon]